jgi:hypothetical protein
MLKNKLDIRFRCFYAEIGGWMQDNRFIDKIGVLRQCDSS